MGIKCLFAVPVWLLHKATFLFVRLNVPTVDIQLLLLLIADNLLVCQIIASLNHYSLGTHQVDKLQARAQTDISVDCCDVQPTDWQTESYIRSIYWFPSKSRHSRTQKLQKTETLAYNRIYSDADVNPKINPPPNLSLTRH